MVILFLGAPGSGKGTQSARLSAELGIPCLSTGQMLREAAKPNTPDAFRLRQLLAAGSMASDETVCTLVAARLQRERSLILDGFPRNVRQAAGLDRILTDLGLAGPTVLHLEVSKEGVLSRLTGRRQCAVCGATYNLTTRPSRRGRRCEIDGGALVERDDDSRGVFLRRFADYEALLSPLVDSYRAANYHAVDGYRDPDIVAADLRRILGAARAVSEARQAA